MALIKSPPVGRQRQPHREASWVGGNIAGWPIVSEPRSGRVRVELRAPSAVPAAVKGRDGSDGERRERAAGAGRRRRGRGIRGRRHSRPRPRVRALRSPLALSLAERSRVVLARRTTSGAPLRHFWRTGGGCVIRCHGAGAGTSTRWRSRRPVSRLWSRRKRGRTTVVISLGCASRRHGCLAGVDGGVDAGRCPWSAWFARAASSGLSRTFWWSRSIA